jgi:lipopolysaccharide transport system permease protein
VLYLPLVLAPCLALALGAAWLLAAAGPFWRDLGPAVNVGLQLLLFATPIFYPLRAVPDRWRGLVGWNPLAICVENVRRVWLADRGPQWGRLALAAALAALLLAAGLTVFRKTKRAFADVV